MNKNDAKKHSEVLAAYAEGKTIQYRFITKDNVESEWEDVQDEKLDFNFYTYEYRIKPEWGYVPFTYEQSLIGRYIISKENEFKSCIVCQTTEGISFVYESEVFFRGYDELLEQFTFADGGACGKMVMGEEDKE